MNQHYVPKIYLKNFAIQKAKGFFVDVYDKEKDRYFETNIKKICAEVDLYTLKEDTKVAEDLFIIEKIYSNGLEPLYVKAYDILTNHNRSSISQLERSEILIAIFQLYLRNPSFIKRSISFHQKEISKQFKEAKENGSKGITYLEEDFSFREWDEDKIVKFFKDKITTKFKEEHIGGIGQISDFHENAIIEITIAKEGGEFFTSDNPLIFEDYLTDDEHPLLKSKEFLVTLNKKVALRLFHDNTKRKDLIYRRFMPNLSVEIMNKAIYEQSSRFVIASKTKLDEHFRLSKGFLDNTSLNLKIDMMKQIVEKFEVTKENNESMEILKFYLAKYDKEGTLSDQDIYEMHLKNRQLSVKHRLSIIE